MQPQRTLAMLVAKTIPWTKTEKVAKSKLRDFFPTLGRKLSSFSCATFAFVLRGFCATFSDSMLHHRGENARTGL
jgi:hypothetical protein